MASSEMPAGLQDQQPDHRHQQSPSPGKRTVRGVAIPPLDLHRHSIRQNEPWDNGPEDPPARPSHPALQQQQQQSFAPHRTATNVIRVRSDMAPDKRAVTAAAAAAVVTAAVAAADADIIGDGGGQDQQQQRRLGPWHMTSQGHGGINRLEGGAAVATDAQATAAAVAVAAGAIHRPNGPSEGSERTEHERHSRQATHPDQARSAAAAAAAAATSAHSQSQGRAHPHPHPHGHAFSHAQSQGRQVAAARHSNSDARSSASTTIAGAPGGQLATPAATPGLGSARPSSATEDMDGLPPLQTLPQSPITPPQHAHPHGTGLAAQDSPRSYMAQPSSRSATSDGRLGTAASSLGLADLEAEAELAPTPPPQPQPAAARLADGIETLDDVMAPALRERIRSMLSVQDALLAHQARMRAYEEEREKVIRARGGDQGVATAQAGAGPGGAAGAVRRNSRSLRLASSHRNTGGGGGGRGGGPRGPGLRSGSRSRSRSASPLPPPRQSVTALPATSLQPVSGATSANQASATSAAAAAAGQATSRATSPSLLPRANGVGMTGRRSPDVAAAAGAATAPRDGPARPVGLSTARSLKRVQLVTTKKEIAAEKGKEKGKDGSSRRHSSSSSSKRKKDKKGKGKVRDKGSSSNASSRSDNNSSSSRSSSIESSSSNSSSSDDSGGDSSSSDGEGERGGAASPPPPQSRAKLIRTAPASASVASGSTATAAAASATATPAASSNADSTTTATTPRQNDGATASEPSLTPQASSTSVPTSSAASAARSYGSGSSRPGRSSIRANVPPPQRIVLPGPQGDLNHLLLLLEKLPSRTPRGKQAATSLTRGSLPIIPSYLDLARAHSPDHRQRLSQQIQQLLQSPRAGSPNGRFSYDITEPRVWGEALAQAALNGFPAGAAAAVLSRCDERQPSCHRGSLSPVASALLLATAEPSGIVVQSAVERQQQEHLVSAAAAAAASTAGELTATAAAAAGAVSGDGGCGGDDDEFVPLAVQVMMRAVPDLCLDTLPAAAAATLSPVTSPPRSVQRSSVANAVQQHPPHDDTHLHNRHHHHHHRHKHQKQCAEEYGIQDLHELHELYGSQLRLHRNSHHQHHHQHHHHHHHHSNDSQQQEPGAAGELGARHQPNGGMYSNSQNCSPRRSPGCGSPPPYGKTTERSSSAGGGGGIGRGSGGSTGRYRGGGGGGGGGGGESSDEDDLEKLDPTWRALRERRRLPPETTLPARFIGPAAASREGGGAHSFLPEQVAAMAGARGGAATATTAAMGGSLAGGAPGGGPSGSGGAGGDPPSVPGAVAVNMPPLLRMAAPQPPAALTAPALIRGGGGALLPVLGGRAGGGGATAREHERRHAAPGGPAGGGSAACTYGNSPMYELYALGLLPNPSLLRASMAAATARPANGAAARRSHGHTSSMPAFGDMTPRHCPSPAACSPAAAAGTAAAVPYHRIRQDLAPVSGSAATMAMHRRAAAATATTASAGGLRVVGPYSAPASPLPSQFTHMHPHVVPGSALATAEAAEAEVMTVRSKRGRSGVLDLQHMLGVDVPPPLLQGRWVGV